MSELAATVACMGAFVPPRTEIAGRRVALVPLDPRHPAVPRFAAAPGEASEPRLWWYM
jgi:hypothetical protein